MPADSGSAAAIRELLTAQLQLAGHDVTVASDGEAALDAVRRVSSVSSVFPDHKPRPLGLARQR